MLRRQTAVCREGWFYLAIVALVFGGALIKEVNLLLILAGMLLGPFLLNWQAVRATLRGLEVRRKLPSRISAGEPLSVDLILSNARRRLASWAVAVEEQIHCESNSGNHHEPLRPSVLFPYVEPGQARKGAYRGRLAHRGRYRFGPMRLTTQFPFGLFSGTIAVGESETLIVLPRLGRLADGWAMRRQETFAGSQRRNRPGPEGDFYGVRPWRPGDGRRLIHWRSSARLGQLVVRQFERPRTRDVAVVLDLWQPDRPSAKEAENVELAVSFAATVLADACRKSGSNVQLAMAGGEAECLGGPASSATLQGLLERLATAEAGSKDSLPALLGDVLPRISSDAEIVLASTRPIDFADASRFQALGANSSLRERARRILCIDASSEQLSRYFRMET